MHSTIRLSRLAAVLAVTLALGAGGLRTGTHSAARVDVVPGMPPVTDPTNLYSETRPDKLSPVVAHLPPRVYVPNVKSDEVHVIDPATLTVIDRFKVGKNPQHVVPSWDLTTLWVTNNAEGRIDGTLTPIDPLTGKPGRDVAVEDPYNMYFTPDGKSAILVAEALLRLDFRDPRTMALQYTIPTPQCRGINHADFAIDGRYALFTCEFNGSLVKVDLVDRKVVGYLKLSKGGMPQDIRVSPDGRTFYVADMKAGGVFTVDGDAFAETGFVPTGVGTHGLYPSRDRRKLYITNRGSTYVHGRPHGRGACPCSTSPRAVSRQPGKFPVAAARTWVASASTAASSGSPAGTTGSST
jgi:YVTN family beta-propeller protein